MYQNKRAKMPNAERRDRLSELPDALVHLILSLLPTLDAVRMSVLSRRWRDAWCSLPVLKFSDSYADSDYEFDSDADSYSGSDAEKKLKQKKHRRSVSECLRLRKKDMINCTDKAITKFKLRTCHPKRNVDNWLRLVAKSRIKELDLYILQPSSGSIYELPSEIFGIRPLTHLRLDHVRLSQSLPSISLPHLMSLSLKDVRMDDRNLQDLLSACSALEKLLIHKCPGMSTPRVSSPSLKFLEIGIPKDLKFQVEAINLESLEFKGYLNYDIQNLSLGGTLRCLSFFYVSSDGEWLDVVITSLPCLESLTFVSCRLNNVKLYSQSLRSFTFKEYQLGLMESEVKIDAPNLRHFSFEGRPTLELSMNLPNLQEARLGFFSTENHAFWYYRLIYFLSNLECSKTLCLHVDAEEALIVPHKIRKIFKTPLPVLKHLKVRSRFRMRRSCDLKDSLFWMIPSLETLTMDN